MHRGGPDQLRFDAALIGVADRLVSPKIVTPVVRWRKMVRLFDPPPGVHCSRKSFQTVASTLADYASRNGSSCFPAVARIAADTGFSERQVQYALAALEDRRLIVRDTRGGRGHTSRYELMCRREPVDIAVEHPGEEEQLELERVRETTLKGATPCTRGPSERSAIGDFVPRPALVTA